MNPITPLRCQPLEVDRDPAETYAYFWIRDHLPKGFPSMTSTQQAEAIRNRLHDYNEKFQLQIDYLVFP